MFEHRLEAPVPVNWLDDTSHFGFNSSLKTGTLLDRDPVLAADVDPGDPASAAIQVGGRHGVVEVNRLREALPDACRNGWPSKTC
jgi:hypothetical protein